MCKVISVVTDPIKHPEEYYHFDWEYRKAQLDEDDADSHSRICAHFKLDEDVCNKYEFNPLTKAFTIYRINSKRDDSEAAEKWANRIDFKTIVEPLIIKPIANPFKLPKVEQVTDEQIRWLKDWDSVRASVRDSVGNSVRNSVGNSVWDSGWNSVEDVVWAPVWEVVWASVWDVDWDAVRVSVWAYFSSFFAIEYKFDFSSAVKLWDDGLVPSFNGTTWRLHSGEKADIVYEWTPEVKE